jgi:hypothetical protein
MAGNTGFTILECIEQAAAKLNDPSQTDYTTQVLFPYAKDAAEELQNELELNGILVLEKETPAPILIPLGTRNMGPLLPPDMQQPQRMLERLAGSTDTFIDMIRRQWVPQILPTDQLRYWSYLNEDIHFVGATTDRDVLMYYLRDALYVTDEHSTIDVKGSKQFMINRIAAMAAQYIGENPMRAQELNGRAMMALGAVMRIGVKSKQGARTRRRPFTITGRRRWV